MAQVDIVPREERCDDGPRPQPMPSMPVSGMGYWQQGQPQQQQQPPMQSGPGEQHMGIPQRPPGMQMDPAMMQAYYMVRSPIPAKYHVFDKYQYLKLKCWEL